MYLPRGSLQHVALSLQPPVPRELYQELLSSRDEAIFAATRRFEAFSRLKSGENH